MSTATQIRSILHLLKRSDRTNVSLFASKSSFPNWVKLCKHILYDIKIFILRIKRLVKIKDSDNVAL